MAEKRNGAELAKEILELVGGEENVSLEDRKSGSAGMPRPISYAVFCLKKKNKCRRREIHASRYG